MKGHNIKELLMSNRDTVKYIAVIAMVIDHIAYMFMPGPSIVYIMMRFAGRVTGPVMAYFIAEGYRYTRSRRKYITRLILCALFSWIPFIILLSQMQIATRPSNNEYTAPNDAVIAPYLNNDDGIDCSFTLVLW